MLRWRRGDCRLSEYRRRLHRYCCRCCPFGWRRQRHCSLLPSLHPFLRLGPSRPRGWTVFVLEAPRAWTTCVVRRCGLTWCSWREARCLAQALDHQCAVAPAVVQISEGAMFCINSLQDSKPIDLGHTLVLMTTVLWGLLSIRFPWQRAPTGKVRASFGGLGALTRARVSDHERVWVHSTCVSSVGGFFIKSAKSFFFFPREKSRNLAGCM